MGNTKKDMNQDLSDMLHRGIVNVTFTKKDGTVREMRCTLHQDLLPIVESKSLTDFGFTPEEAAATEARKPKKKENADVRTVFDLDARSWRSFRWDSVTSYTLIGE